MKFKELTAKDQRQYKQNENYSYHCENLILLARQSKDEKLLKLAIELKEKRDKLGGIYPEMKQLIEMNQLRDSITSSICLKY